MTWKVTGRKEENGANTHYRITDGSETKLVTRAEAVALCEAGKMSRYHVIKVEGVKYLRDNPDTSEADNINSQPLI